ncbi:cysteine-rich protein 1-like isoform X1 [Frankliniella occidentalis]|uniref:Cysteine-rich protein 1-like isoform X1 n=1 Tax=Frankliniella occidentalis TaxID=133901 RepID=A0A9C6UA58_FRAOC|nr:cysteine-rich protein 1-like isoform X1 [Frankliniella occidentalis]
MSSGAVASRPLPDIFVLCGLLIAFQGVHHPGLSSLSRLSECAERKTSLGKDWHGACLRCEKCNKTLTPGSHAEHEGKPYCNQPCYAALFGPAGFGRGGAESYVYNK